MTEDLLTIAGTSFRSQHRKAVEAGRLAFLSGRIPRTLHTTTSSPVEGVIGR